MLIGEVARRSGVSPRMLRHYDSLGLVSPSDRTAVGYRDYSETDLQRLFRVESLRSLGLGLPDVRRALEESGSTAAELVDQLIAQTRERISAEQDLLQRLRRVRDSGPTAWHDVLHIVSLLRGLYAEDSSQRKTSALSTANHDRIRAGSILAEAVLSETDSNVAGALRWALERSGDGALEVLEPALNSSNELTRHRAVTAIAELSGPRAKTALMSVLTHPDATVRHYAAITLGSRGEAEAIPVLVSMVVDGKKDVEAAEVMGTLAHRHDIVESTAGGLIVELEQRSLLPEAKLRLVQSLAEFPGPTAQRALKKLCDDEDPRVASTAGYLLVIL